MAASGTYDFLPPIGELVAASYRRIGTHRSELTTEHFTDARNECNLLQAEWACNGPLLYTVDLQTVNLVQGTATYSVPVNTIMVLDVYISIPNGDGTTTDRIITPLSRTEYAGMPQKSEQSAPTSYWYDRLASPSMTLWPVPNGYGPYTMSYYRFTQAQDATFQNATQPAIPYLWLSAYVGGLAYSLAMIYKRDNPVLIAQCLAEKTRSYNIASQQDTEGASLFVAPQCSSYWR